MGGGSWRGVSVRESENAFDRYGVAVKKDQDICLESCVRCFCDREIHSRKCERRARACGIARTIIRTVCFNYSLLKKIHCRKYFVRLIFVALCDYENFSTTKISRFTVNLGAAHRLGVMIRTH